LAVLFKAVIGGWGVYQQLLFYGLGVPEVVKATLLFTVNGEFTS